MPNERLIVILEKRVVVSLADVQPMLGHCLAAKFAGSPGVWGVELELMRIATPMYPSIGAMVKLGHEVMVRAPIIEGPARVLRFCAETLEVGASAVSIPSVTSDFFADVEEKEALEALHSLGGRSRWLHVEFEVGADDEGDDEDDKILGQLPTGHTQGMRAVSVDADFALLAAARLRSAVEAVRAKGVERAEFLVPSMGVRLPVEEVIAHLSGLWDEPSLEICAVLPDGPDEAMALADKLIETLVAHQRRKEKEYLAAQEAAAQAAAKKTARLEAESEGPGLATMAVPEA